MTPENFNPIYTVTINPDTGQVISAEGNFQAAIAAFERRKEAEIAKAREAARARPPEPAVGLKGKRPGTGSTFAEKRDYFGPMVNKLRKEGLLLREISQQLNIGVAVVSKILKAS